MSFSKISALAGILSLASTVAAHGHVTGLTVDGTFVGGWDLAYAYTQTPPDVPGWATKALDNGFVAPSLFGTSDIACHLGATAGKTYATVAAGSTVNVKWDTWPESHHGPVIDAMAACPNDDCTTATAGALEFFVIAKKGLVDGSSAPGKWASDELMAAGNTWDITIPKDLAPGNYVLRHEIIALHGAGSPDGAQNYPQCLNLKVTGSGSLKPAGVTADKFYTPTDPGILVSIYQALGTSYVIPGPAVFSGGDSSPAAPATTSAASPVATSSPVATVPAEEYPTTTAAPTIITPPYSNSTIPTSTRKSACKPKTTSTAAALPTSGPSTGGEEYPSGGEPSTPTVTVVPTPLSTPSSPTTPITTTPSTDAASSDLPTGTTLSSVLSWISSFYTKNKGTVYTGATSLKKRSHARAMRM